MPDEVTLPVEKIGMLLPVLKSAWEQRTSDDEAWWLGVARASMDRVALRLEEPKLVEAREECKIDGLRLHGYDEEGNEIPEQVVLRYEARGVRRREDD